MILKFIVIFTSIILFSMSAIQLSYSASIDYPNQNPTQVIFIDDDGGECNEIGLWDRNSRTCLLTQDVEKYIHIIGSNLTIDGNGHHVQLKKENYMRNLTIDNKQSDTSTILVLGNNIVIKNMRIEGFSIRFNQINQLDSYGISCRQTEEIQIKDSEIFNHAVGIACNNAEIKNNKIFSNRKALIVKNCQISDNIISDNYIGMNLSTKNNVENNIIKNSEYVGFYISDYDVVSNNIIDKSGFPFHWKGSPHSTIENNSFLNYQNGPMGDGKADGNYWDSFDSRSEGCTPSLTSNICNSSFVSGGIEDSTPWKIQNGWLYEINTPEDLRLNSDSSDGVSADFSVSAKGPDGALGVTCMPSSDSMFSIGKTEVICSIPNGIVSTFSVTVIDTNKIIQKQQQENTESGLIAFLKLASLGLGIFLLILLFTARKRKNQKIKESSNNRTEQYHQYDNYQKEDYQKEYKSQTNSYTSQKLDSKDYDLYNLSKEDAFEILEVSESFTSQEIKTSRNRLINQWHPDKHKTPLYQNIAEKQTKLIITSYELLRELGYAD